MANNEHPPEHTATPTAAPIEQPAAPTSASSYGDPHLDECAAISMSRKGLWSKRSDYSQEQWAAILWNSTIPGDDKGCKIFYEGTKLSIVRDFLNGLPINGDTKAEIIEGLFS